MAADIYGATGWQSGFGNGVKVRTYAENNSCEIEAVGRLAEMQTLQPKTGDAAPFSSLLPTAPSGESWKVQNSTLTNEPGGIATMRVSCVSVNANGVYDISWDIDMQEVQRSLEQHPTIRDSSTSNTLQVIQMWKKTPEAIRVYSNGTGIRFRYYNTTDDDTEGVLTDVTTGSDAEKYMLAVSAGIETYNVYLPVVTQTSKYLTTSQSGGIPYPVKLGHFDTPPVKPSGYSSGNWFKSCDKYSRAKNGVWTRTEQWTYTDDTTHSWIYGDLPSSS